MEPEEPFFKMPPQVRWRTLDRCMYCSKAPPEVELTKEHPIPFSLGGHRYLADAACKDCAQKTSGLIEHCCTTFFAALRLHHSMPSRSLRKRRPRKDTVRIGIGSKPNGPWTFTDVPKDKAPGLVIFPVFRVPEFLFGAEPSPEIHMDGAPIVAATTADYQERAKALGEQIFFDGAQPFQLARLLAHMAYGYFVSQQGIPDESPLPAIIMGDDPFLSQWIGGTPDPIVIVPPPVPGVSLHQIWPVNYLINGKNYLAVQIRLFSYLIPIPPVYSVIVAPRDIAKRDAYFSFTSYEGGDGVHIEPLVSMI